MLGQRLKIAIIDDKLCIRDPKTKERLTSRGKFVIIDPYWMRRIKDGHCVILENNKISYSERGNDGDTI